MIVHAPFSSVDNSTCTKRQDRKPMERFGSSKSGFNGFNVLRCSDEKSQGKDRQEIERRNEWCAMVLEPADQGGGEQRSSSKSLFLTDPARRAQKGLVNMQARALLSGVLYSKTECWLNGSRLSRPIPSIFSGCFFARCWCCLRG